MNILKIGKRIDYRILKKRSLQKVIGNESFTEDANKGKSPRKRQ